MNILIVYEDGIYQVCKSNEIKNIGKKVYGKYGDGYWYPAKIIAKNSEFHIFFAVTKYQVF